MDPTTVDDLPLQMDMAELDALLDEAFAPDALGPVTPVYGIPAPDVPPPVPVFKECFGLPQAIVDDMPPTMLISSGDIRLEDPALAHLNGLSPYALSVHAGLAESYSMFRYDIRTRHFALHTNVAGPFCLPLSIPELRVGFTGVATQCVRRPLPRLEFTTVKPVAPESLVFYVAFFDVMTNRLQELCRIEPVVTKCECSLLVDVRFPLTSFPPLWQSGIYIARILCTDMDLCDAGLVAQGMPVASGIASPPFHITAKPPAAETRSYFERYVYRSLLGIAAARSV